MQSIPFTDEEAEGFELGCWFTFCILKQINVDLKRSELVAYLTEIMNGEQTLVPPPSEVKLAVDKGNLDPDKVLSATEFTTIERNQWDELHQKYARLLLNVASGFK